MSIPMDLFGVIGRPILHSRSPEMHNAAFAATGIDARYVRLAAPDGASALRFAEKLGARGLNVTAPFKEVVARLSVRRDRVSDALGAANTLVAARDGWHAHNTDTHGVLAALFANGVSLEGELALVLGAGGAARAAVYALMAGGARVVVANRTRAKARTLARQLGCEAVPLADAPALARRSRLVVSTLSTDARILPARSLTPATFVMDARYQARSALVSDALSRGCEVVDGRDWLLLQAAESFRIFTRREAPMRVMARALTAKRTRGEHLALIGFMGAGKTVVGAAVAERLGLPVHDTDTLVERSSGLEVPRLLLERGEPALRRWEAKVVRALPRAPAVISCGGGLVNRPAVAEALRERTRLVVWLWASAQTSVGRILDPSSRPLLGDQPLVSARKLLARRKGAYAAACDVVADTEGRTVSEVADQVVELWEERA